MISCTEFIPAYSELFTFLDERYGRPEVERFWTYLFEPTGKGIPLINFAREKGLRGCWEYWNGTLKEEAADVDRWFSEEGGWMHSEMLYCPSKGRLLELEKEIGLVPYYDYCGHCDYYHSALDLVGLKWIRCHVHVDEARCSSTLYDPKRFKGMIRIDENTEYLPYRSKGAEYFHRDFHSSLNMGIDYLGRVHGEQALRDYLAMYTDHVYIRTIEAMADDPLGAVEARIRESYRLEKAEDALETERTPDTLRVRIAYCPAVRHLQATGREVSPWFSLSTEGVMARLAERGGLTFAMESYDPATGAAAYGFRV